MYICNHCGRILISFFFFSVYIKHIYKGIFWCCGLHTDMPCPGSSSLLNFRIMPNLLYINTKPPIFDLEFTWLQLANPIAIVQSQLLNDMSCIPREKVSSVIFMNSRDPDQDVTPHNIILVCSKLTCNYMSYVTSQDILTRKAWSLGLRTYMELSGQGPIWSYRTDMPGNATSDVVTVWLHKVLNY